MGGSEEAAYFMAHEMAALGYRVTVYNEVRSEEAGEDPRNANVIWRRHEEYDADAPPDVFVAWRYHISLGLAVLWPAKPRPKKVFLWLQDAVTGASFTREMCEEIDGIMVLSEFHKRLLPEVCRSKGRVTPNGIDVAEQFREGGDGDGDNSAAALVYGSSPNRGLELVLDVWPEIHERLRKEVGVPATLTIYYGFSESFVAFGRAGNLGEGFEEWMEGMQAKIATLPGVVYEGMVSHEALVRGYAGAGFMLYPTTYPETGCVTLMKAMCAGAVPITSRFGDSTLPELTGRWDEGPERALTGREGEGERREWEREYVDRVVESVIRRRKEEEEGGRRSGGGRREEMKRESRTRFSWKDIARKWHALITE